MCVFVCPKGTSLNDLWQAWAVIMACMAVGVVGANVTNISFEIDINVVIFHNFKILRRDFSNFLFCLHKVTFEGSKSG